MPRTLTEGHLNRAALARQQLLERAASPLDALESMGGLQAQYAPAMYIGLWSRVSGLERGDLTRSLEARTVVQGTLQRSTIHLVTARDYWQFAIAVRQARREWWLRVQRGDPGDAAMTKAAGTLRAHLREHGVVDRQELEAVVGKTCLNAIGLWLDLVRVPPSGTWERRRADLFAAAADWIGPEPELDPDDALDHIVVRYLGGFGPAPLGDIAKWAGLKAATVNAAVKRLDVVRYVDERGKALVDLPGAPIPEPDTPAPVRFLAVWDAVLLVHARRTGVLPEEHRPTIFTSADPHSDNTFLVDGRVAGVWAYREGHIDVEPFAPLPKATQRAVDAEAQRLAVLYA